MQEKSELTMTMVYRLVNEESEERSRMIKPPPSTVSIVLAKRFGVSASKSCTNQIQNFRQITTAEQCNCSVKLYLQYAHAKCVAEDPLRVLVLAIGDV